MAKTYVNIGIEQGSGGGGAVDSVNGKVGSVAIIAGSNITINNSGASIQISSTGGGGGSSNSYFPGGW